MIETPLWWQALLQETAWTEDDVKRHAARRAQALRELGQGPAVADQPMFCFETVMKVCHPFHVHGHTALHLQHVQQRSGNVSV